MFGIKAMATEAADSQPDVLRPAPAEEKSAPRVLNSEELFAGQRTVVIQHGDEQYRLLITRNDRLILQK
jgi:hemin uptake protein HemP